MVSGRRLVAAVLIVLGLTLPGAPAHAQEGCAPTCHRPDIMIRGYSEQTAAGNNIYNTTASGQTKVRTVMAEHTVRFALRVENDGGQADDLVIAGTRNQTWFGIRYYDVGGNEISARVRNHSYTFHDVDPGERGVIVMAVTAKAGVPVGRRVVAGVSVRSGAEPTIVDRARAVVYASLGRETPILAAPFVSQATGERWAEAQGASPRFVDNAALYWELAPPRGVRPEVAYAQSAKETGYGHFGGVIDATFRNPCGLKTTAGGSDSDPAAHKHFTTWRQGVTACIDHLALYAGAPGYPRSDTPDPRHFASVYGTAKTVERLGGAWAPAPDYGISIVNDYLNELLGS